MTPDRWARIKDIFNSALETPEAGRAGYVESACAGDAELRAEVERLLADHATGTLPSPAAAVWNQIPAFAPGDMLAQYRVDAKLGEGGMGVVYGAYDTRLERPVALKLLLPDPDRQQRLLREARAASALNHSNIVTIHEIGTAHGVDFIAMEYVEGRPLSKLVPPKGLPAEKALDYAIQIADALAHAHAAGVVHRDLKPANIMVTAEGRVKLLDFGLARRVTLAEGTTATLTVPGTIAGTPAYMSPEQAEGRKTDQRSDIFSFGVVLYEMLTGHRAFAGETTLALLAAILHEEPTPLRQIVPATPRELERLVALCLKKDPARRFQHIDDVKIQLASLQEDRTCWEPGKQTPKPEGRRWTRMVLVAVALAVAVGLGFWRIRPPRPDARPELIPLTSDSGVTIQPAISRDGHLLAYASDRAGEGYLDIWVQQIDGGAPIRLTRGPADEMSPDFSPDGARIVFASAGVSLDSAEGKIYVIPSLGGEPRLVSTLGQSPRFSPDGGQIAYSAGYATLHSQSSRIYVVDSAGGQPRQLVSDFYHADHPLWTPDGKHLLFVGTRESGGRYDWWVTPLDGGAAVKTGVVDVYPKENRPTTYTPGSAVQPPSTWIGRDVVFSERGEDVTNLWRVPISARTWRVAGSPRQLTFGAGVNMDARASAAGRVVFANQTRTTNIWKLPVDTARGRVTGELHRLTSGRAFQLNPCLSPDERTLAFVVDGPSRSEVILKDLASGKEIPVFTVPRGGGNPDFSSDGTRLVFATGSEERRSLHVVKVAGGVPEMVCAHCGMAPVWSRDGASIMFDRGVPRYIGLLELATGKTMQILSHPAGAFIQAQISQDGRWISFVRMQQGRSVQVAPFRGAAAIPESEWFPVVERPGGLRTRWSPDGNWMYFTSSRDGFVCLWAQRLDPATKRPIGAPVAIQHFHAVGRRLGWTGAGYSGISVGKDWIALNVIEETGNIWGFKLPEQ